MKAVMVMFDSLNRHLLPPYNAQTFVHAPNFERLARRAATFDTSYVCSMPCMPARRDFHTGRPNFLHCPWGALEPFDDSAPQMLSQAGVYTHLASDHYHYWEDGGATYHNRYDSWQFFRGQEGDSHIGQVAEPKVPDHVNTRQRRSDWVNRQFTRGEQDLPQSHTFNAGLDFIHRNHDQDNWFLQIETFDPHEPFFTNRRYKDRYPTDYMGPLYDWPKSREGEETPERINEVRRNYASLVSKCDASLGDVLDAMDEYGMWEDTLLIVWTDHGFLLGEHGGVGKNWPPLYEELGHTPFFMWDPRAPEAAGQRREALVQPSIDLGPTLLEYFGVERTEPMRGKPLRPVVEKDQPVRDAAIFGYHGKQVNVTDGRHVYMRASADEDNQPLFAYTLMTTKMRGYKPRLAEAQLAEPFSFTREMPLLRLPAYTRCASTPPGAPRNLLYDLQEDPHQEQPLTDEAIEQRMIEHMTRLMDECDAPAEQYERLGIEQTAAAS